MRTCGHPAAGGAGIHNVRKVANLEGRQRRRKGHDFERYVAQVLRAAGFEEAYRESQARTDSGHPDVQLLGHHLECKHQGRVQPEAALRQAIKDSRNSGLIPVAVTRKTNSRLVLVTMRLDDFIAKEQLLRSVQPTPPSGDLPE